MICVKNKITPDFLVAWEQKLSTRGHQALQEHSHEPELPSFYFFQQKISNNYLLHFLQVITHILFFTLVYFIGVSERISATTLFLQIMKLQKLTQCHVVHCRFYLSGVNLHYWSFWFLRSFLSLFSLQMFRKLHVAYTDMFCNPFYNPGENITSRWDQKKYYSFEV